VDTDELTIGGQMQVCFDDIRAILNRTPEGRQRIFGALGRIPPMRHQIGF
jgi:hypothetical protein